MNRLMHQWADGLIPFCLIECFCFSVVPKLKVVRWQAARERGVSTDSTPLMGNSVAAGKGLSSGDLQIDVKSGGEAEIRGDQLMSIFWRLWKHAGAVFVNYWVTLSIFPGVLAEDIQSAALKSWYDPLSRHSPFTAIACLAFLFFPILLIDFLALPN